METLIEIPGRDPFYVETYAFFTNVDKSILKVNPIIEPLGYKFIAVSLNDLERDFSALFSLPAKFVSQARVSLRDSSVTI